MASIAVYAQDVCGIQVLIRRGDKQSYYFPREGTSSLRVEGDRGPTPSIDVNFGSAIEIRAFMQGWSRVRSDQECQITLSWETFEEIVRLYGRERRGRELMLKVISSSRD